MPLLEVTDLDKTFTVDNRSVTAIDRLSLSIDEHEFVSIVGPSGCGKSTFLHILGGFEPASGGDLRLNGRPIGPPGPDRGMMFQELSLFPWLTAIENVAWPLEMKGLPKRERLPKAAEYLDLVHLSRFADLYPGQLSGGMKQRVALARLFALDPEIMLMDEPFGALDSQTRELLQEELQSGSNLVFEIERGDRRKTEAAMAAAAKVVELSLNNNRLSANPIEPRSYLCDYDAARDRYTLYATSQQPHYLRRWLSVYTLHIPEHKIRVDLARCRRRLRRQGQFRGRGVDRGVGRATAAPPGQMDRDPHRDISLRRAGARSRHHRPHGFRSRRPHRGDADRHAGGARRLSQQLCAQHSRQFLSADRHRPLQDARTSICGCAASTPTPCRSTPIAARAGRRRPGPTSG